MASSYRSLELIREEMYIHAWIWIERKDICMRSDQKMVTGGRHADKYDVCVTSRRCLLFSISH